MSTATNLKEYIVSLGEAIRERAKIKTPLDPQDFPAMVRDLEMYYYVPSAEDVGFGSALAYTPDHTATSTYAYNTSIITASIDAKAGDWILATTTTRSSTTYPSGWTLLHESTVLSSDSDVCSQRMAFLYKKATEDGPVSFALTQSESSNSDYTIRSYVNLICFSGVTGFKYHSGSEMYSNTSAGSVTVSRPSYDYVVWGCSASVWNSSAPYGKWSCGKLNPICYDDSATQPRLANFVDGETSVSEHTFIPVATTAYIIDYVEVLGEEPEVITYNDEYEITDDSLNALAEQIQRVTRTKTLLTPAQMISALSKVDGLWRGYASTSIASPWPNITSSVVGKLVPLVEGVATVSITSPWPEIASRAIGVLPEVVYGYASTTIGEVLYDTASTAIGVLPEVIVGSATSALDSNYYNLTVSAQGELI